MITNSTTRTVTLELERGDFETLKQKASDFGCSFGDLAKVYVLEGLKRSGQQVASPKPSGAQGRWAAKIEAALADGRPATVKDLCANFGANHLTIRPVVAFMVAAGTLIAEEANEHRKQGRIPMAYRLAAKSETAEAEPSELEPEGAPPATVGFVPFDAWPEGLLTHNDASKEDLGL